MADPTDVWNAWGVEWRGIEPALEDGSLRQIVERASRRMRRVVVLEVLVTVVMLGLTVVAVTWEIRDRVWLLLALLHSAVVWAFALWNRRGTWVPLGVSTRDYLALAIVRCRRGIRSARFAAILVAVELAAVAVFLVRAGRPRGVVTLALIVVATWLGAGAYEAHTRRRLARWLGRVDALGFADSEAAR